MLGLYLYTYIISHKIILQFESMLNKLTLQKELHNCVTNNVFLDKKLKDKIQELLNTQKIKHKNPLPEPRVKHGTYCTPSGRVYMHHNSYDLKCYLNVCL